MSYLKVTAVGNLGRDAEMRYLPSGQAVTNFTIATNRQYTKSDGEKVKEVLWLRVSTFGKIAEVCHKYLHTGSQVLVDGRLIPDENGNPRVYTKQDGTAAAAFEVNADRVVFLGGKTSVEEPEADNPF